MASQTFTGLVLIAWFGVTATLSNWSNGTFLKSFSNPPIAHLTVRFVGAALLSALTAPMELNKLKKMIIAYRIPALCLFVANGANSVAIMKSGITLTYVIKSLIPVFTALHQVIFLGKSFTVAEYASLAPTIVGVSMASAAEGGDFSMMGFCAAMLSSVAQTALNIFSKTAAASSGATPSEAFYALSLMCGLLSSVIYLLWWIGSDVLEPFLGQAPPSLGDLFWKDMWSFLIVFITALAFFLEYSLNFVFVVLVAPLSFSIADIGRRLATIAVGAVIFNKPLTMLNIGGALLASGGVGMYTVLQQKKNKVAEPTSPKEPVTSPAKTSVDEQLLKRLHPDLQANIRRSAAAAPDPSSMGGRVRRASVMAMEEVAQLQTPQMAKLRRRSMLEGTVDLSGM